VVFIGGAAATPVQLVNAMADHGKVNCLENVTVCHMHTEGPGKYCLPDYVKHFKSLSFFMGKNVRKAVAEGYGTTIPIFLHEIPLLFRRKIVKPDVAMVTVMSLVETTHSYKKIN